MKHYLIIILILQFLNSLSLAQTEKAPMKTGTEVNLEMTQVVDSLASLKNPFKPFVPDKPPIIIKPEIPVEIKEPVPVPEPEVVVPPKIEPPSLTINGIVWGDMQPQAIINGTVVNVGDEVSEAKVLSISQNGVQLDYKGVKVDLKIESNLDKNLDKK